MKNKLTEHQKQSTIILFELMGCSPAVDTDWAAAATLLKSGDIHIAMNPKRSTKTAWPLAWDVGRGPTELLRLCIERGMPVRPILHPGLVIERAIHSGIAANLQLLIEHGALVGGEAKPFGHIHRWCCHNNVQMMTDFHPLEWRRMLSLLVEAGAEIDQIDQWGRTPLMLALVFHCDVNDPTVNDYKPQDSQYLERALMLIAAGANVNLPLKGKSYSDGRWPISATPLFARPYGDGKLHLALLKAGADPLIRCTKPTAWNAIEFAELTLARLKAAELPAGPAKTAAVAAYTKPPLPDDPESVKKVIAAMKKAAAK